jgi:DNA polymerase III sliding clamp (beta) subunit (PCNA family)
VLIHREALALASNANSESDGRYCLNFVKVTKEGHVIGCDGHHFLRIKAKVEAPSLLDALLPQATEEDTHDALIPADVLASFAAGIKKMDENAHVVITTTDDKITLASTDGICERTFVSKPPDLPYPDVDKALQQHPTVCFTLNVELLTKLLRTLKACGATSVRLGVKDAESSISVMAFCDSGPIDGSIMPMKD